MNELLKTFLTTTSKLSIPTVIIGGLALPAYHVVRTTLDIDLCIYITSQDQLDELLIKLNNNGLKTLQTPKIDHDLFIIFGKNNEAEIWLKPCDTFDWDNKMVEKIKKFKKMINVLAVEDYILTKIARSDRSSTDISDVLQILIANENEIDWNYLHERLKWAKVKGDFKKIIDAFSLSSELKDNQLVKKIYNEFKKSEN